MKKQLVISTSIDFVRIAPDKIVYIASGGNYSTLVQTDNEVRMLSFQLGQIEKLIDSQLGVEGQQLIRIRYRNLINGYRVSAMWQPEYVGFQGKIIGKAILNFSKGDTAFSMVHSHFFLQGEIGISDSEQFALDYDKIYEVDYPIIATKKYLRDDVPFFFVDGGEKLVLTIWFEGQRHQHSYHFYQMEDNGTCIQNGLGQITYERPYNCIDESTDITKDRIIIHLHNGAFYWTKEYYQRLNADQEYELQRIEQCEEDTIYTYRPLELIEKKRITNQ